MSKLKSNVKKRASALFFRVRKTGVEDGRIPDGIAAAGGRIKLPLDRGTETG